MSHFPPKLVKYAKVMWGWWSFVWQHLYQLCNHREPKMDFFPWSCLLCTHVLTFQQSVHVFQALCCSPLAFYLTPRLSDSTSRRPSPPKLDSEAEWMHLARQLHVVVFAPRRQRCFGKHTICLEELEDVLSRGISGLWVDTSGSYQEWHPCSAVDRAERKNNW